MQTKYPSFTYNNESFIIIPGSSFSRKELKTRLSLMGVDDNNRQDKTFLINLYESTLKDNQNKLKIIPQLRKDTDNITSKLAMSQRQSLPSNIISNNPSQLKSMNISYDIQPFNLKEKQINFVQPMNTNKGQYSQNPFISSNISINQDYNAFNYEYSNNTEKSLNNNYEKYHNNNLNSIYNFNNSINDKNNSSSFITKEIHLKKNNDNSIISNSNNSRLFNQKIQDQINRDSTQKAKYILITKQYKEDLIDNNININNNNYSNNNTYIKQYEEKSINTLDNNNNQKDNRRYAYQSENNFIINNDFNVDKKTFTNFPNESQYSEPKNFIFDSSNNLNNTPNFNNSSYLDNPSNNKSNNNEINYSNYNNQIINEEHGKQFLSKGDNNLIVNTQRDPDEVSNFSFFSKFKNIKNYPFYKNGKLICFHTILLILILSFAIGILHLINYSLENISDYFEIFTEPLRLIESIFSFISAILFGTINYFYITIPLIIFAAYGYYYFKKYFLRKRIKEIFQKIKEDLINDNSISNENKTISEDNIYSKYVKKKRSNL